MDWITVNEIRLLNGLPLSVNDPNYVEDEILEYYLDISKNACLHDFSIQVRDDQCKGIIDGVNSTFSVSNYPIIDRNLDGSVGKDDIDVYAWSIPNDPNSKSVVDISTIDPIRGIIVLKNPIGEPYKIITADYRYSNYEIDYNLLKVCLCYLTGYYYFVAEYMELPLNIRVGAQMYRYDLTPSLKALNSYLYTMNKIKSKIFLKG